MKVLSSYGELGGISFKSKNYKKKIDILKYGGIQNKEIVIDPELNHKSDNINLKIINLKRLGFLVVTNTQGLTTGVFTDGDLKRLMRKSRKIDNLKIKDFMTKKPFVAEENMLASEILSQMNKKKITNVCIYSKKNKHKTIGVLHIHDLLNNLR